MQLCWDSKFTFGYDIEFVSVLDFAFVIDVVMSVDVIIDHVPELLVDIVPGFRARHQYRVRCRV